MNQTSNNAYRPDIDGLRAIAVISVVLYHFGVPYFNGGFVGVDVFFVISGYLITGIVLAELRTGSFSFARFYERRARRLLPTLTMVFLVTFAVSLAIMTPRDFEVFSKSMFYALIFAANIFFDSQGGYFGPDLELAPLLHTWSLAVEEQFYIAWPLLLVLAFRYARTRLHVIAALLLLASFYANVSLVETKPVAAFYRPHTRVWELLAGCTLAFGMPVLRGIAAQAIGVAGMLFILFAVFTYTAETQFPGVAAAMPVLGAAMVIWSGQSAATLVSRLLSIPPLVFVGLISYAWYLWHWPMISLFRYQFERQPSGVEIVSLLVASIALAALSWKFVETPVRRGSFWRPRSRMMGAAAVASVSMMALAGTGYATKGFAGRYPPAILELSRIALSRRPQDPKCLRDYIRDEVCTLWTASRDAPHILLWGDSHARGLGTVMRDLAEAADVTLSLAGIAACPPIIGVGRDRGRGGVDACRSANGSVGRLLSDNSYSDVVLVARWNLYAVGDPANARLTHDSKFFRDETSVDVSLNENRAVLTRGLRRTVEAIAATGARVWVVMEPPAPGFDVPNRLARQMIRGEAEETMYGSDVAEQRERSAFMQGLLATLPVRVLDPSGLLCETERCLAIADGKPLYFDDNHLSIYGTARLAPLLTGIFSQSRQASRLGQE
jgi:peptidoglycan/LPS O-acetylase OafA/YrhL